MNQSLKQVARRIAGKGAAYAFKETMLRNAGGAAATQRLITLNYKQLISNRFCSLPSFDEVGFREYSEFEEDGILLFLFSVIKPRTRTSVEICAGNGIQCNTANLIINHGWFGCLFDGNPKNVALGRDFYSRHRDTFIHPPAFTQAWITAENVNDLILKAGACTNADLLSLDIDGMDYWVWKAINVIDPLVVVCEVNNAVPRHLALTVPYNPDFIAPDGDYRGASLRAMCNLAREKGYRLVGTHRFGFNAFFVKNGTADEFLPEVSPDHCANDPFTKQAVATRWPNIKDRPWESVQS